MNEGPQTTLRRRTTEDFKMYKGLFLPPYMSATPTPTFVFPFLSFVYLFLLYLYDGLKKKCVWVHLLLHRLALSRLQEVFPDVNKL